jgi:hypothetical protein|tara:strand:- start:7059 stop:7628 length:570 start_codon:yes stop_codon:yes gene_type:complete
MIKFNAKTLAAVALAQSTDAGRYFICGVHFTGTLAVATNGHLMTVGHDPDADNPSGIFPISKKAITAMKTAETVIIENDILKVYRLAKTEPFYLEPCQKIEGTFPDWQRILPTKLSQDCKATFAAPVITTLAATAKSLGKLGLRITGTSATETHWVNYRHDNVFSIAMPIGPTNPDSLPPFARPEWLKT